MPEKIAVINYDKCNPGKCGNGECAAVKACEKKVLKQEEPYDPPFIIAELCTGCYKCITACSLDAIEKFK